ncbi:hypothetical protein SAMN05660909_04137 [Chitinophaga terrae (ex Kim and Jung 2007)]|jgi:hypothetical protein|uniref:Uncharacterized protein n=1 Tax=Chitinophaga terrae (ex Kim and Jung 2007) TaxID=408074 RepID=A0A1H4F3M3_9BACT|nr:hypothetical protein [Chitinophaga terrae (ex Kim and Jung 2007)]MDQ0106485.1 hypothetical protein [Chitinophaga terrae (ex Kim and Jung 2007)]GEP92030.1 hypothetical protein CTE07_36750 [Chitinophaga terrae (ex Kim and Jung 2007)]SEA91831.1 hypothetical protein SAMN05660909_04137 [Chitinophaga terrae (ex Kim and Jung 2007)]
METHSITVIIDGKPYGLIITIDKTALETAFQVVPDVREYVLEEYQPHSSSFTADHTDSLEGNIRIVEAEQIARIIWEDILDKMK